MSQVLQEKYVRCKTCDMHSSFSSTQTQHVVSKLRSGESYDKAMKGLPPKSKISKIEPDKSDINEVFERLDRIEHNIKTIATFLDIEMDERQNYQYTTTDTNERIYRWND